MSLRDQGTAQAIHYPWNTAISPGRREVRGYLKNVHRTLTEREGGSRSMMPANLDVGQPGVARLG